MHAMQILEIAVHGEQLFIADDALQASYQQFVRIALTAKKPVYSSEVCQELKTVFASSLLPIVVAYEGDLFGCSYDAVQMQRILRNLIVILFHVPVEESWEPYQTLCELVNRGSPVCYSSLSPTGECPSLLVLHLPFSADSLRPCSRETSEVGALSFSHQ